VALAPPVAEPVPSRITEFSTKGWTRKLLLLVLERTAPGGFKIKSNVVSTELTGALGAQFVPSDHKSAVPLVAESTGVYVYVVWARATPDTKSSTLKKRSAILRRFPVDLRGVVFIGLFVVIMREIRVVENRG
jgi:hypothetical protein